MTEKQVTLLHSSQLWSLQDCTAPIGIYCKIVEHFEAMKEVLTLKKVLTLKEVLKHSLQSTTRRSTSFSRKN